MQRRRYEYDLAYIFFFFTGVPQLVILAADMFVVPRLANPESNIGLFWLVYLPLFLIALAAIPCGILLSIRLWKHWPLWVLAALNISYFTILFSRDYLPTLLSNIHSFAVISICALWFLVLRWRLFAPHMKE
jgi:hypothetical protein